MSNKGKRANSPPEPDDLALFHSAMSDVKPLRGKGRPVPTPVLADRVPPVIPKSRSGQAVRVQKPAPSALAPARPSVAERLPSIETKLLRAIRRGTESIEARLDLHGMTQEAAHAALGRFVTHARRRGFRIALVVTGKGQARRGDEDRVALGKAVSERGVLRRILPLWLSLAPLHGAILGVATASPHHGGEGAVYLHLRKVKE